MQILIVLSLISCKTSEKVTEKQVETVQTGSLEIGLVSAEKDGKGQMSLLEGNAHAMWSDSVVEKFHERIVTDSTGRILHHEMDHTKDTYSGKRQNKSQNMTSIEEQLSSRTKDLSSSSYDSIYDGDMLDEVKLVQKEQFSWLLPLVLLGGILSALYIIAKKER